MKQYTVTGMSCAACQARVEKAVSKVDGVTSCAVSLLTNSMGVEGSASEEAIIRAVTDAGYGAELKGNKQNNQAATSQVDELKDTETPVLKKRLMTSLGFLLILMYISMGHTMWGWPLPAFLDGNHIAIALSQLLLTVIVMVINQKFFINGFKSLWNRAPNMDALVALGASAAFGYSTWALFMMTAAGDEASMMSYMHDLYFESAAMILTLITIGKMLEARSKGKTTDALKGLMKLAPKTAQVIRDGVETEVAVDQVNKGDVFVVRPGESIPVDGAVIEGESAVDESSLTGESIPEDKSIGSLVSAGTINQSGFLRCEATRVGEDTTLSQIIKMVSDAAATKAPIAKAADKVSGVFVPVVIGISLITLIGWLLTGESSGFAVARAISVLVISCPCALGLATPVAIMVGNGVGARNGVLFKTASSLEQTGKANMVVLDKTGTITKGEPYVTDIIATASEEELLRIACSLESRSEHPLAKAVVRMAEDNSLTASDIEGFEIKPGNGLMGTIAGNKVYGGNLKFINSFAKVTDELKNKAEKLSQEGKTPLFFAEGDRILGIIAVADIIKEDSPRAIEELKNMGIKVVMLTGDNERTARTIAEKAMVDDVIAGVLPGDKEREISKLKQQGTVIMIGDGINDAPALTSADIGIAIGAGSDIAIDAADVVLMKSSLLDVPAAIRLSRATLRNIHENLFWAFIYNTIGIPLAAGLFISILGWRLNPMIGAAAMSLSSFSVVTNALRLNLVRIHDAKHDRKIKHNIITKENETMTKTMTIEGMMCPHCEKHVKNALEALEAVESAAVSHVEGTAVLTLTSEVADEVLTQTVVDAGYEVKGIE